MPRALAVPVRQTILARQQKGQDAATIAAELHLCLRTVQNLLRRFREAPDAVAPCYPTGPRPPHSLLDTILDYRREHATWGAALIRAHLGRDRPDLVVPCTRTLQRWLRGAGLSPAPPGRKGAARRRAEIPHAVWQIDAVEQLPLASGQLASWLRVTDECSGAFLQTRVSPPGAVERGESRLGARAVA
jgi:transposase